MNREAADAYLMVLAYHVPTMMFKLMYPQLKIIGPFPPRPWSVEKTRSCLK